MNEGTRRRGAFGATVAAIALGFALLPAAAPASHDHHKVYTFSIDGLDPEALGDGFSPNIDALIAGQRGASTTFYENSRSVMFAETNPNHAAMITGAFPNRSGIVSNEYGVYQEIEDEDSCPVPGAAATTEPNATSGESSVCLQVPTIMETLLRRKHAKHITTALIMGKPKLAKLFATSNVHPDRYDAEYIWAPCSSSTADYCDSSAPTQPITSYSAADSYVMDEVMRTVDDGVRDEGRSRRPDYTFVNLPQVDSAGHVFGGLSSRIHHGLRLGLTARRRLIANQKELGIWDRTIIMIVSDHSMADTPFNTKIRLEDVFDAAGVPAESYEIVANAGSQAHIYLTNRADPARDQLLKQMRDAVVAGPGSTRPTTATELRGRRQVADRPQVTAGLAPGPPGRRPRAHLGARRRRLRNLGGEQLPVGRSRAARQHGYRLQHPPDHRRRPAIQQVPPKVDAPNVDVAATVSS